MSPAYVRSAAGGVFTFVIRDGGGSAGGRDEYINISRGECYNRMCNTTRARTHKRGYKSEIRGVTVKPERKKIGLLKELSTVLGIRATAN